MISCVGRFVSLILWYRLRKMQSVESRRLWLRDVVKAEPVRRPIAGLTVDVGSV